MPLQNVEIEFERDGDHVVLSVRTEGANFILTLPLAGAATFAATAQQVVDDNVYRSHRARFILAKSQLEVSR